MRCYALLLPFAALALAEVPVPKSTLVPVTATSYPFGSAATNVEPLNLDRFGYVEEEFLVSGTANVYDWAADGALSVKTPNAPYTTRILLRRPKSASKFSGTVIVEVPNTARRFDWWMLWGYAHPYFMDHGDAYVGVTLAGGLQALKSFDDARYGRLSMANPTPGAACPGAGKGGPSDLEEGLRWDILSQVAAALKSNLAGQPMTGMKVERIFMATQGGEIVTYINAIHDRAKLANGKPAYDGYMVRNLPAAARINQCAIAPAAGDARRLIKGVSVPVVNVIAQGELADGGMPNRRPDSDDPNGRYRSFEIAGAAHIDNWAYVGFPSWEEQKKAVGGAQGTPEFPFAAPCEPAIPLSRETLLRYSFDNAFYHLDQWARKGIAPPKGRLEVADGKIVMDENGLGQGGVRSPWVDTPVFTTVTSSPGPGNCRELGHHIRFDEAKLVALYGTQKNYLKKMSEATDRAVKAGYFLESDGKKIKEDLTKAAPLFDGK